jgi:hypothetical protein
VSEHWASSCRGKKHYNSPRKAQAAAKASQIVYGVPMNEYLCDFCGKYHVGNTLARNGKKARMQQENETDVFVVDNVIKQA